MDKLYIAIALAIVFVIGLELGYAKRVETKKKQLKALEILKHPIGTQGNQSGICTLSYHEKSIAYAIAELEALQAPKTCGGYAECENASAINCSMCIRYHNYSDCYKPKDNE